MKRKKNSALPKTTAKPPMPQVKPPLGVEPRYIHEELRRQQLSAAIVRYAEASLPVPLEWVEEYNELIEREKAETPNNMKVYRNNEEHMKEGHTIIIGGRNFNDCMRRAKAEGIIP